MTVRYRMTIPFILLLTGARVDAATLRGLVIRNELGGPPMPNVQISAVAGANPTVTKSSGTFKLDFPHKQPGDIVQLVVSKRGYVVVNDMQLRRPLPRDPDSEPLTILLCKPEVREEMARRFYHLKSFEAIDQTYTKHLKELKEKHQEKLRAYAAEVARLRQKLNQARGVGDKMAEELARLNREQTSDLFQEAVRLFVEEKIEDALSTLDEERLRQFMEDAKRQKAGVEKVIQDYLLRAHILTTQFRFEEAENAYRIACEEGPESFQVHLAFGVFCHGLDRHDKAIAAYERCLELARKSTEEANVARTLNNLGVLHSEQNRKYQAHNAYEEALTIHRRLAKQNPKVYLPAVALTLNNLGILYRRQNQPEEALKAYEEALAIRRQLAEQNPESYLRDVADTLNSLGILHAQLKRRDKVRALKAFEEALMIRQQLAEYNAQVYLPDVAMTLNNLGILHKNQNRMDEARKAYEEALTTYRQLAEQNPQKYLPYVAGTLNNIGILHNYESRMYEARKAYEQALSIYEKFARQNPNRFGRYVEGVKRNLENLDSAKDEARDQ